MMNKYRTTPGTGRGENGAGFPRAPLARTAAGMARAAGDTADRAIPGTRRGAGRPDAGRPRHSRGARLRQDRRDALGYRLVHHAPADGGVRRPRFVPPSGGGRGFRDRGDTGRRAHRSRGGGLGAVLRAGRAAALLTAGMLLAARLARLSFLANFM